VGANSHSKTAPQIGLGMWLNYNAVGTTARAGGAQGGIRRGLPSQQVAADAALHAHLFQARDRRQVDIGPVAAELPAELTPTLLQLLTDLPPTERPEGYGLLWRVVGRCGPEAAGAVDVFETHWPAMTFGQRAAAMRAVAKLGPRGVDRLCTMLEDDRHGMREQACRALAEAGSDAHRAIPVLLKLLGDEDNTQRPLTDTVKRIDPSGAHSRKVVKDWLESDHAEDRRRGRDVNEIVEELFRPPPQRWTGGGMF